MKPLLLLVALLAGCGRGQAPSGPGAEAGTSASPTAPDLVLLVLPGLRADPPGTPGAERSVALSFPTAPSRIFAAAYAQSSSRFLSLGSLFTGLYPSAIPLCGLPSPDQDVGGDRPWCTRIPESRYTLAGVLGLYGYRTALYHSHVPAADALARGFDHVVDVSTGRTSALTDWTTARSDASAWWSAEEGAPRLLVVVASDLVLRDRPDLQDSLSSRAPPTEAQLSSPETLEAARQDQRRVWEIYARAGRDLGLQVNDLLAALPSSTRARWTVLTSTNGIHLGEPSDFGQNAPPFSPYEIVRERTVRVPLLLWDSRSPSSGEVPVSRDPVELVDLFPTLANLAGAVPPAGLAGQDLLSSPPDGEAVAYSEFGDMLAVRKGPWLLTFRALLHYGSALDPELTTRLERAIENPDLVTLYDVTTDPLQMTNLTRKEPTVVRDLWTHMVRIRTTTGAPPPELLTPERLWDLRMTSTEGYW